MLFLMSEVPLWCKQVQLSFGQGPRVSQTSFFCVQDFPDLSRGGVNESSVGRQGVRVHLGVELRANLNVAVI